LEVIGELVTLAGSPFAVGASCCQILSLSLDQWEFLRLQRVTKPKETLCIKQGYEIHRQLNSEPYKVVGS
jgi:hypothetical protein